MKRFFELCEDIQHEAFLPASMQAPVRPPVAPAAPAAEPAPTVKPVRVPGPNKLDVLLQSLKGIEAELSKRIGDLEQTIRKMPAPPSPDPDRHQELMGRMGDLGTKLGDIERRLDSPPQPLSPDQEDRAYTAINMLQGLAYYGRQYNMKLVHSLSNKEVPMMSLKTAKGKNMLLSMASRDRRFKLLFDGGEEEFNVGDVESVTNAMNAFYDTHNISPSDYFTRDARFKTKPMGTQHGNAERPIPLFGEPKKRPQKGDAERRRVQQKMEQERIEAERRKKAEEDFRRRAAAAGVLGGDESAPVEKKEHTDWQRLMLRLTGLVPEEK